MVTSESCPQCGAAVAPGATSCTACGRLLTGAEPASEPTIQYGATPPSADEPPRSPETTPAPAATPASKTPAPSWSASDALADVQSRWGVGQSPLLMAGLVMALAAFAISTLAVISYLTAGDTENDQKFDAQVWFYLGTGLAIGVVALFALLRLQSGSLKDEAPGQDRQLLMGVVGFSLVFMLLGLFKGSDESLDAADAWFSYAFVYAFFALALAIIARPIPEMLGTFSASMAGLIAIGVAVVALLIGTMQGRSNDFSTYALGISLQQVGQILMLLAFAWFSGMRKAAA